jgi:hypothetical protein
MIILEDGTSCIRSNEYLDNGMTCSVTPGRQTTDDRRWGAEERVRKCGTSCHHNTIVVLGVLGTDVDKKCEARKCRDDPYRLFRCEMEDKGHSERRGTDMGSRQHPDPDLIDSAKARRQRAEGGGQRAEGAGRRAESGVQHQTRARRAGLELPPRALRDDVVCHIPSACLSRHIRPGAGRTRDNRTIDARGIGEGERGREGDRHRGRKMETYRRNSVTDEASSKPRLNPPRSLSSSSSNRSRRRRRTYQIVPIAAMVAMAMAMTEDEMAMTVVLGC